MLKMVLMVQVVFMFIVAQRVKVKVVDMRLSGELQLMVSFSDR